MQLKEIVDKTLKDQNRSLSWLAAEMGKTFDGLKLSLVKGSIKYIDIQKMAEILEVNPASLFGYYEQNNLLSEDSGIYHNAKTELKACKELIATLKSQVEDKQKIIDLLSEKR